MHCPKCNCENPEGKKFCGDCGGRLQPVGYLSDEELQTRIRAAIKEELADQKVVEVEITESVLERITDWAKKLAFFGGIPLAALVVVLGLLGLKKYSDLWELASAAQEKIGPVVERAQKSANEVDATTQRLQKQSGEVEAQMATLKPKVEAITKDAEKFAQLEKSFDTRFAGLETSLDKKINDVAGQVTAIKQAVPGLTRWPVKTGQDADRDRVAAAPVVTTVEELRKLTAPSRDEWGSERWQTHRMTPVELSRYTVEATIVRVKREMDGDYEAVIQGSSGATMIVESSAPDPTFVGDSPWLKEIGAVRKQLDEKFSMVGGPAPRPGSVRARITGVGFFDLVHGQSGVAPNGIELHPILRIEFLE